MRWLRATMALGVLALLLGGIPTLLLASIGNPGAGLSDLTAGDVTDSVLIDLLATVAWLAWAQFALATMVEAASAIRRTPMPRRIPWVMAGQQELARVLVTAVLLSPGLATSLVPLPVGPAPSSGMRMQAAVSIPEHFPKPSSVADMSTVQGAPGVGRPVTTHHGASGTQAEAAGSSVYVVPSGEGPATYWDLAVAKLGHGERWHEIWRLNEGRRQSDGTVMTSPNLLRPGWTVLVPAAPETETSDGRPAAVSGPAGALRTSEVTVQPGDTLSQIVADHGDGDWHRVWDANAGRMERDGRRFTNPDLIQPGWKITLLAGSPLAAVDPAPSTERSAAPITRPTPRGVPESPAPSISHPSAPPASDRLEAEAPVGQPSTAGHDKAPVQTSDVPSTVAPIVAFAGGGGVLAGLTLAALRRRRRRQFRHRRPGRMIAATPAELAPLEKALLADGVRGAADLNWLNEALRSLVHTLANVPNAQLPDVLAVRMSGDLLELVLAAPQVDAPPPWQVDDVALRWSVRRSDPLPFDVEDWLRHFAPYPTLATVAYTDAGEHWLLDLERIGALTLAGDPQRCEDLGRFLAAELAHNTWSEQLHVTVAGFGEELRGLNPTRVAHPNKDEVCDALTGLRSCLQENNDLGKQSGVGVLAGRLHNIEGDGWAPQVLLIAPPDTGSNVELRCLLDELRARDGRAAVAVVVVGATAESVGQDEAGADAGWQLLVDADGTMALQGLGLVAHAQQLPPGEAADLVALLSLETDVPDRPMPPARGEHPWDHFADVTGALRQEFTETAAGQGPTRVAEVIDLTDTVPKEGRDGIDGSSVLPMATSLYVEQAATLDRDVERLAPFVSEELRQQVTGSDPDLDSDLADWHDSGCRRPKLRLLGPVLLTAWGQAPDKRPAFYTEVVTYLASRAHGATLEQFASDLWPDDPDIAFKTTPRQAASVARTWLGVNPRTGQHYLPKAPDGAQGLGVYRVRDLLVDAELFRRLRLRGVAGGAAGIADLEAALSLVVGAPLDQRRPEGYRWLVDMPLEHEYTAMIVDVAHVVATHHLASGAPESASAAAHTALSTGARDDVALLDLVAVSDAVGNHAEAAAYVKRIMANHEAEVEEDLPTRTYGVLLQRLRSTAGP
jgi:hypothetical protein